MTDIVDNTAADKPVVHVRLEGDLMPNTLGAELSLAAIGKQPAHILRVLRAVVTGRMDDIAAEVPEFDFTLLPWRQDLLKELERQRAAGATIVLHSKSSEELARRAVAHLDLFDEVRGKDSPAGGKTLAPTAPFSLGATIKAAVRALRPHQWIKNILVFVPLVVSGDTANLAAWSLAGLAFIAFSFVASSIYLLNDLTDLDADRTHARKRFRPLAAGTLPVAWGLWMMPVFAALGLTAAFLADGVIFVLLYAILSISYSLDLKKRSIYDVFALAALYTVRMYGGGEMSGHSPSAWLLAFSVFLFLGLALMKRVAELVGTESNKLKRRGYRQVDAPLLMAAGVASSFGACLVLALYLDSDEVRLIYSDPFRLWMILPFMLFWQLKLWHFTIRGKMTDDPIVFAVKNRISWVVGALCLAVALSAGYWP